jgi:hypothetical protein
MSEFKNEDLDEMVESDDVFNQKVEVFFKKISDLDLSDNVDFISTMLDVLSDIVLSLFSNFTCYSSDLMESEINCLMYEAMDDGKSHLLDPVWIINLMVFAWKYKLEHVNDIDLYLKQSFLIDSNISFMARIFIHFYFLEEPLKFVLDIELLLSGDEEYHKTILNMMGFQPPLFEKEIKKITKNDINTAINIIVYSGIFPFLANIPSHFNKSDKNIIVFRNNNMISYKLEDIKYEIE